MPLIDDLDKLKAEIELLKQQQAQSQAQLLAVTRQFDALSLQVNADAQAPSPLPTPQAVDLDKEIEQVEDLVAYAPNSEIQPAYQAQQKKNALIAPLTNLLAELSSTIFAPVAAISAKGRKFYQHYQAKGLGPVFLMTLAGIITLTFGVGYLLQFSINHWLSDLGKAVAGIISALLITAIGIFIRYKRPGMEDFGSGLVGLGIILNYLCLYFLGPYFNIVPEQLSFGLLLLNTLFGYGLAIKLETKVVAIVALVGGSLAPLLLINSDQSAALYLPYLLLLGGCSLLQSYRLAWPTLMQLTALLHIACIQYLGIAVAPVLTSAWFMMQFALHGLFYLYSMGSLYLLLQKQLTRKLLAVPIALFIFLIYQVSEIGEFVGEIFILNTLLCITLSLPMKRDREIAQLALVFAASFAGFAALYLLNPNLLGLVLLLEGVLLVWIGTKHQLTAIRFEAYSLLLLGLGSTLYRLFMVLSMDQVNLFNWSPTLFASVTMLLSCALLAAALRLLQQHLTALSHSERRIKQLGHELLSLFLSSTILLIAFTLSEVYFLNVIPLICALLLYLSARQQLRFTEILAWLWLLPLVLLIAWGTVEAGSMSFSKQMLNAQLARVALFICLSVAYYWYQRSYTSGLLMKLAFYTQLLCFFILPLLFIPKVLRDFSAYIALALWLSSFISVAIAYLSQHRLIRFEATVLIYSATAYTALLCLEEQWQGLAALTVGVIFMLALSKVYQRLTARWQQALRYPWYLTPYYFALTLLVITQTLITATSSTIFYSSWAISALLLCGYLLLAVEKNNRLGWHLSRPLKASYQLAYGGIYSVALIPVLLHSQTGLQLNTDNLLFVVAEAGILIFLAIYITAPRLAMRVHQGRVPLVAVKWFWHILLIGSYLLWAHMFGNAIAATASAIVMVIHASILMFLSLRPKQQDLLKLAGILFTLTSAKVLLIDMASFQLVQKVIAFIVIGCILLIVAYFYQRNKNALQAINEQN